MQKLKVLMCSEASFINSGFGNYNKEILSRLHKTNKYEIAEFASYGFVNDPRDTIINWRYYANAVRDNDPRKAEYASRGDNQFGRWRFEKVLIDFKPDVVIDVRDYWMTAYQRYSPLRKFFHWILMPTVDSYPQQEEWIDTFLDADAIFTYSDWGADMLRKQSSGKINIIDTASPGIDPTIFKIKDKATIKDKFGIDKKSIIIGSVMRNQKRKLIPELLFTLRQTLDKLYSQNLDNLADNLYLYLHTSYPDMGWDLPELLKQYQVTNKVLFSYICKNCKNVTCSKFQGVQKVCQKCLAKACSMTSVTDGADQNILSDIYNMFDMYVQYAICEGFGMPQVEAGACGVPIATVNYSAMSDIIKNLGAYPIRIGSYFTELETKATRVYPDNDDLTNHILEFLKLDAEVIHQQRINISAKTHKLYNWDTVAQKWETYLDKLDNTGYRAKWTTNNYLTTIDVASTKHNDHNNFYMLFDILSKNIQNIDMIGDQKILELLNNADYGFMQNGMSISAYDFEQIREFLSVYINNFNQSKQALDNNIKIQEDFIQYAELKSKL